MKRTALLILLLSFLYPATTQAQAWRMKRYEAIVGIGTSNYFGDIGGYSKGENALGFKDISLSSTRPSIYLGARYKLYEPIAIKLNLITGFISGSDEGGINEGRNFKFSATIFEPSVQVEYSFLKEKEAQSYLMMKGSGMKSFRSSISAYVFVGIGGGFFWPKAKEDLVDYEIDYNNVIDAIIASNQLILAATTLNLGSNFIVEFGESINQLLMVEGELSIIGLIPIGETTDKGYQGLKRSISDLAFHNTINKKFNFDK